MTVEVEAGANGINERGQIVGASWSGEPGDAYVWRIPAGGGGDTLRRPSWEPAWVWATAINDDGTIVGGASTFDEEKRWALSWSSSGKLRLLAPLRQDDKAEALDVNNKGWIVGWSGYRAAVWEKGKPRALPGGSGEAHAINDRGVIAGVVNGKAVLWAQGKLRRLGTLGGTKSQAIGINDRGQVLGWSRLQGDATVRGFLWQNGRMVDLGPGFAPKALNNRGQIVGSCRKHACVWQSGTLTMLDDLGWDEAGAADINERQQIVGFGVNYDFSPWHDAVLWTYKP